MTTIPTGEIKKKGYAKYLGDGGRGGSNKGYYGKCANGEFI